jgi:hypothetical protein
MDQWSRLMLTPQMGKALQLPKNFERQRNKKAAMAALIL